MSQFVRLLLLAPTAFAPLLSLIVVAPAHASSESWVKVSEDYACVRTVTREPKKLVCKRLGTGASEAGKVVDLTQVREASAVDEVTTPKDDLPDTFELTDEESDASVALFGCDCPACVRSLRKLRSLTSSARFEPRVC
ncbi:hypothetical protein OsccyDRAFT_3095 [Leptolyngbyaceae cyanobacterium JSC-12]|nr:hypothetical protein OsccyDRAFT_3095 [Leptolyngbyaceae cyanobacterium JSC-12]